MMLCPWGNSQVNQLVPSDFLEKCFLDQLYFWKYHENQAFIHKMFEGELWLGSD